MSRELKLALIWMCAAMTALAVGLFPVTAFMADGQYVPIGPDAFYHARRILEATADGSAFFQFDALTHVPEGNLITWPWCYDFAMSLLVRLGLALRLTGDPMAVLAHIPVLMFTLSLLLVLSICRSLDLSPGTILLALLATALFPLNQAIYSGGNIDHHHAEHLFVLGTLAAALRWLRRPDSRASAVVCGVTFGLATGVHTALFILQAPLLATFLTLWLRRQPLPSHRLAFVVALLASQLAVALPSLPLRLGHFNYYTLSWFQPYVAACTAVVVLLLGRLPANARGMLAIGGVSLVLLAPMLRQAMYAGDFFTASIAGMEDIIEVRSVFVIAASSSLAFLCANYTWLILLLPGAAVLCALWLWRPQDAVHAHFALVALVGMALLLAQARLHYFGSFALYLPWLLLLERVSRKYATRVAPAALSALTAFALLAAYLPGLQSRVFAPHFLSDEPNYAATRQLYGPLARRCTNAPGTVLAHPFEGHYIRYHSSCSVLANNFLVTPHDVEKWRETVRLLSLPASQVAATAPGIRYVLVRRASIFVTGPDGNLQFAPGEYPGAPDYPLVRELLAAQDGSLPAGFELIFEMRQSTAEAPFARLFAIHPSSAKAAP